MEVENVTQILIYFHAGLGGIALLAGLIALSTTKGSPVHKKTGRAFFYTMLASALLAVLIACLPGHKSPFLFAIGIFSIYLLVGGFLSLRFKQKELNIVFDKIVSWTMIVAGVGMITYPLLLEGAINIVLMVFGMVGLIFAVRDLRFYQNQENLRKIWLRFHLVKMTSGYIAAVTAFVVVNNVFPSFYGWFIPGIIGTVFITYWVNKVKKKALV